MDVLLRHRGQARQLRDTGREAVAGSSAEGDGEFGAIGGPLRGLGRQARRVAEKLEQRLAPVLAVAEQSEVRERLLRAAELALALAELVAELDEDAAPALALVLGQAEDAGDVVALCAFFLFAEVADEVAAVLVARRHAVEEEGVDIVVEGLVVEEELAEEAEVAAPGALAAAVDFEEGDVVVAVDFVSGWVLEGTFLAVSLEGLFAGEVAQAELVDVDFVGVGEGGWVRGEVPRLHFVFAHLEFGEVAHKVQLRVVLDHRAAGAQLFDFFFRVGEGVSLLNFLLRHHG